MLYSKELLVMYVLKMNGLPTISVPLIIMSSQSSMHMMKK